MDLLSGLAPCLLLWGICFPGSLSSSTALGNLGKVLGAFTIPPVNPSVAESPGSMSESRGVVVCESRDTALQFDVNEHHFSCSYALPVSTGWGHVKTPGK